jgi:hypothetical protein
VRNIKGASGQSATPSDHIAVCIKSFYGMLLTHTGLSDISDHILDSNIRFIGVFQPQELPEAIRTRYAGYAYLTVCTSSSNTHHPAGATYGDASGSYID